MGIIDVYKLYHKPSGMFYRKATATNRSNLSKFGELYRQRPKPHVILGDTYCKSAVRLNKLEHDTFPVDLNEWVVVIHDSGP